MAPAALRKRLKGSCDSDSDLSGSDYLSESEVSDVYEEPEAPPKARSKKKKRVAVAIPDTSDDVVLFCALSHDGADVGDLAWGWIDQMESDLANGTTDALTEMFNLILRCCGCRYLAEKHDLANYDSAPATVAEVGHVFQSQKTHEYPFMAKGKNKFFRQNVSEFFEAVVEHAHDKGLLHKDNSASGDSSLSSPMMNAFLPWVFALSGSDVRPFRYVATCVLCAIQEKLCKLAAVNTLSVEKQQRQLTNARNNSSARGKQTHERKIRLIEDNLSVSKIQRDAVVEYLGDIFQNVFNCRYKDVDVAIRAECLKSLAQWASKYPDMFLQPNYLRYFGWMLSDPADAVKKEALRGLHKLYKNVRDQADCMPVGLRQLTDSFKQQLISMVWLDAPAIKSSLFAVYTELGKLGFLSTDSDVRQIYLYGFFLAENAAASAGTTEYCQSVGTYCELQASSNMEKYAHFLSTHESLFFGDGEDQLDVKSCLKYKALIELLGSSYAYYCEIERPKISVKPQEISLENMVKKLVGTMYMLPWLLGQWEAFLRYVLLDVSLVQFSEKDNLPPKSAGTNSETTEQSLKEFLRLAKFEKHVALCVAAGMLLRVLTAAVPKKNSTEKNPDDLDAALPVLVRLVPRIEKLLNSSPSLYALFVNLWNSLLVSLPTALTKLFSLHSSADAYSKLNANVMAYFVEMDTADHELSLAFETYFTVMFKSYNGKNSVDLIAQSDKLLNTLIFINFEDMLLSIVSEATEALLSKTTDILHAPEEIDDEDPVSEEHRLILARLLRVLAAAQKLSQIAKSTNINRFVGEPILESPNSLLEIIQVKLLSKTNMQSLLQRIPKTYARQMPEVVQLWASLLRFLLLTFCWSLEDLTYASGDRAASSIDILVFMADYEHMIPTLCSIFISVQTATKEVNDTTAGGNQTMHKFLECLVNLQALFGVEIADLIHALRMFFARFSGLNIFKNFDQHFDADHLKMLVRGELPQEIQKALLSTFLVKEALMGKLLQTSFERGYDDDVNIEDLLFVLDTGDAPADTQTRDSEGLEDIEAHAESIASRQLQKLELQKWVTEKDLCVYLLKMLVLEKTNAFSATITGRFRLNAHLLGDLFQEVIRLASQTPDTETIL